MTWALPPSASRRSVCRKSPPSLPTRQTSTWASLPGVIDESAGAGRSRRRRAGRSGRRRYRRSGSRSGRPDCRPRHRAGQAPSALARPSERASGSSRGSMLDAEPALLGVARLAAELDLSLRRRPCGCAGSLGRFGTVGVCCVVGTAIGCPPPRQSLRHAHDIDAAIGHELRGGCRWRRVRARQRCSRLRRRCAGPCDADSNRNLQSAGASNPSPCPAYAQSRVPAHLPAPFKSRPMGYHLISNLPRGVRTLRRSLLTCKLPLSPSKLISLRSPSM